jgi:hypothetical protein
MNRILHFLLFSLVVSLVSCKSYVSDSQGITGTVTWLEGNQMPTISDSGKDDKRSAAQPIKRTLHIYPLIQFSDLKMEDGLFTAVATKPLQTVETDEKGKYSIQLAPGRYSVLVVEEGGMFASIFDGDGNVQPVTVKENQWTLLDIQVNYKAAF